MQVVTLAEDDRYHIKSVYVDPKQPFLFDWGRYIVSAGIKHDLALRLL